MNHRTGPLADIRIVDLTQYLAGPFCTMLLADLGADVIKVEPPGGDPPRGMGPLPSDTGGCDYGGYFASVNRNKRSIVLDLKQDADRDALLKLIDSADALIENSRAGTMDRLGLGYETLHERKPALVYAAIRGFGDPRTGLSPYADRPCFDVVSQSMGGLVSFTGPEGGPAYRTGAAVGDIYRVRWPPWAWSQRFMRRAAADGVSSWTSRCTTRFSRCPKRWFINIRCADG